LLPYLVGAELQPGMERLASNFLNGIKHLPVRFA